MNQNTKAFTVSTDTMNQKCLHKSRVVQADSKLLWTKWTTHTGLKSFIGLDNKVDLIPGGPYEIYFLLDNPEGTRGGEGNKVLSFLPYKMLSFTWNAPPTIPEVRNHAHKTWVVVQLEEISAVQTKVSLDHLGWLDGEKWDETYTYFDRAWDIVLDSLEACLS
ncbi:MAG: SRPBCC domain-containing protein [Candidatus Marinimicrobia bacterium]|nr:SRPBCC domain-containing protein [Candidatus Neomarinimicrobiota bacterium]